MSLNNKKASPLARKFYVVWNNMRRRCENPGSDKNGDYFFKGIKVCERWRRFENFRDDLWESYQAHGGTLTLDRIESSGNYEPSNCRWVTRKVQSNNQSRNKKIELFGRTENESWWASFTGINRRTIRQRLNNGWSPEDALLTTPNARRRAPVKREQAS